MLTVDCCSIICVIQVTGVAGALGPPAVLLVGMGSISSTKMWYTNYDWSMTMVAIAYSCQGSVSTFISCCEGARNGRIDVL